jgi:hypothetical protein
MRRLLMKLLLAMSGAVLMTAVAACGPEKTDEGPEYVIEDQPLQGAIAGAAWEFQWAQTSAFLSDEDGFFTELFGSAAPAEPACDAIPSGDGPTVLISLPREPGDYAMSLRQNGTFTHGDSENEIATDGLIRIDDVTDTTITGGLAMESGDDFSINGNFEAPICPE